MTDPSFQMHGKRFRIYINNEDRWQGKSLYSALLETLREYGVAETTTFRGMTVVDAQPQLHTNAIESLRANLPVMIEVIDTEERISDVLKIVSPMVREGLVIVDDVEIIKYSHR